MSTASPIPHDRRALRRSMRAQRRALSAGQQIAAAHALARQLARQPDVQRARRIAVYLCADGEIDPLVLFRRRAWRHKQLALPVLQPLKTGHLLFMPWHAGMPLHRNRFGIGEPRLNRRRIPVWTLDVIVLPLVAFDDAGNRLGMGGGFYDRTLGTLAHRPRRPVLLGVAHHFQRTTALTAASWDVALDGIVTDQEYVVTD